MKQSTESSYLNLFVLKKKRIKEPLYHSFLDHPYDEIIQCTSGFHLEKCRRYEDQKKLAQKGLQSTQFYFRNTISCCKLL